MTIILLQDVLDLRARQRKELQLYKEKKEQLERQISYLSRDLQLTEHILRLIEAEQQDNLSIGRKNTRG